MNAPTLAHTPIERILELVDRFDTRGPRYTSYPTVPVWGRELPTGAFDQALGATRAAGNPVAIYLHLPFCAQRCLYCGCNAFITHRVDRIDRYGEALEREIEQVGERLGGDVKHQQLHLGGGTPTHLPPALLARVLDRLIECIGGAEGVERSVEVDPRNCTDEHLALLTERGFHRISIGVQDVEPTVQQAVGRIQPLDMNQDFVARARAAGFESVNVDLIYGLPRQTAQSWHATLEKILTLRPDRLACFGYAHLPKRMKHQRAIDASELPAADERLALLLAANRFFREHGYRAIGMDHFARAEDELSRAHQEGQLWRNFMGYTTIRGLELIGMGCSAICELDGLFCQNETAPERYDELVLTGASPLVRGHLLDDDDRYRKALINDLMCNLEIRPAHVGAEHDLPVPSGIARALAQLTPYAAAGLLEPTEGGYHITELGQLFLRNLAMPFDRYLDEQSRALFSKTV